MTAATEIAVTARAPRAVPVNHERRLALWLAAPCLVVLVLLFLLPLLLLLGGSVTTPKGPSLAAYTRFLGDAYYRHVAWNSLRLAVLTTGFAFAIGYPAAFAIARARGVLRSLLLAMLFLPLAASVIVKAFAWTILLRGNGIVNFLLLTLGLVDHPQRMIFTDGALVVGSVNIFLPFMILPIYTVVAQIDPVLAEAAGTLGAPPLASFLRVILPLSMPGIVAGLALTFSLSVSAYVVPTLLMGENYPTLATTIYKAFLLAREPQFGSAAGVILLAIAIVVVAASSRLGRPRTGAQR